MTEPLSVWWFGEKMLEIRILLRASGDICLPVASTRLPAGAGPKRILGPSHCRRQPLGTESHKEDSQTGLMKSLEVLRNPKIDFHPEENYSLLRYFTRCSALENARSYYEKLLENLDKEVPETCVDLLLESLEEPTPKRLLTRASKRPWRVEFLRELLGCWHAKVKKDLRRKIYAFAGVSYEEEHKSPDLSSFYRQCFLWSLVCLVYFFIPSQDYVL